MSKKKNDLYEDYDVYEEVKPKKKKAGKKKKQQKKIIIMVVIEIIAILVLLGVLYFYQKWEKIEHTDPITVEEAGINEDIPEEAKEVLKGYTNIALFGLDTRSSGNYARGNSDTIMVCSINNDTKEVRLISIYRDTYLMRSDDVYGKINAAYAYGGAEGAIRAINRNLDLDITDYVAVDFAALIKAIDMVGGLEITLTAAELNTDVAEYYTYNFYIDELNDVYGTNAEHINSPGTYLLDGVQATAYCRLRNTAGSDFARASRQREVLKMLVEKAKKQNVKKLNDMVDEIFPYIATSLSEAKVIEMMGSALNYDLVGTGGFPFHMATGMVDTASVVVPCTLQDNVAELYEFLFGEQDYTCSKTVTEISSYIQSYTGYTASSALDYGFGIDGDNGPSNDSDVVDEGLQDEDAENDSEE